MDEDHKMIEDSNSRLVLLIIGTDETNIRGEYELKGIILAGGRGTRLHPLTVSISKHLLPVFDKPMIYYPLSTLMFAGIKDILLVTTSRDLPLFKQLLGSGAHLGIAISYAIQDNPNGLAEAFLLGEEFISGDRVVLILGDNIFIGKEFQGLVQSPVIEENKAVIFGYRMENVRPYGVINYDSQGRVISLEEKPAEPTSEYVIPGLYFYDSDVVKIAKQIEPSKRGELEITSVNQAYLKQGRLAVQKLSRDVIWFDVGDFQNLCQASRYVERAQKKTGTYIACVEEIAYYMGYIDKEQLMENAHAHKTTEYGAYLYALAQRKCGRFPSSEGR